MPKRSNEASLRIALGMCVCPKEEFMQLVKIWFSRCCVADSVRPTPIKQLLASWVEFVPLAEGKVPDHVYRAALRIRGGELSAVLANELEYEQRRSAGQTFFGRVGLKGAVLPVKIDALEVAVGRARAAVVALETVSEALEHARYVLDALEGEMPELEPLDMGEAVVEVKAKAPPIRRNALAKLDEDLRKHIGDWMEARMYKKDGASVSLGSALINFNDYRIDDGHPRIKEDEFVAAMHAYGFDPEDETDEDEEGEEYAVKVFVGIGAKRMAAHGGSHEA